MAVLTCGREELRLRGVTRVCAGVVIRLMAAETGSRQRGVVVVYVAVCTFARRHHVRSGQRECGVVVVERRIRPRHRVMAHGARCREPCRGVRGIIGRCVILLVAGVTRTASQVVVAVDVAGCANVIGIAVTGWKWRVLRVIERRIRPRARVMAVLTGGGEELRLRGVARVCAGVVISLMAAETGSRQRGVIVVYVAVCAFARRHHVRSGQREPRGLVVKLAMAPEHCVVTTLAGGRETGMGNGSRGASIIFLVAGVTRCAIQRVIVVDMTIGTLPRRHSVRSSQRESGAVVVEGRIQPGSRVVTGGAGLREVRSRVIWICRTLVILQVTGNASRAVQVVVVVDVAIGALSWRHGVHSRQRECGQRMVKRGIGP